MKLLTPGYKAVEVYDVPIMGRWCAITPVVFGPHAGRFELFTLDGDGLALDRAAVAVNPTALAEYARAAGAVDVRHDYTVGN